MRTTSTILLLLAACQTEAPDRPRGTASDPDPFVTSGSTTDTGTTPTTGTTGSSTTTTTPAPPACYTLKEDGAVSVARIPAGGGTPTAVLPLVGVPYYAGMVNDLAWMDGSWFACDGFDLWVIDGQTGTGGAAGPCHTIAEVGGRLWVEPYRDYPHEIYDFAADVIAGSPTETRVTNTPGNSRSGGGSTLLYSAWHSTDTIEVYDPALDTYASIPLESYDDWVWGVEEEGGILRLLDDGRQDPNGDTWISRFDAATGQLLGRDTVATNQSTYRLNGLWCAPGAP